MSSAQTFWWIDKRKASALIAIALASVTLTPLQKVEPASAAPSGAPAYVVADKNATSQAITGGLGSTTKLTWGREVADPSNSFDLANSQLKATSDNETWLVGVVATPTANGGDAQLLGFKNGSPYARIDGQVPGGAYGAVSGSTLVSLNTNDTFRFEIAFKSNATLSGNVVNTRMWAIRVEDKPHFIADKNGMSQSIPNGLQSNATTRATFTNKTADSDGRFSTTSSELTGASQGEAWLVGGTFTPATDGGQLHSIVNKNGVPYARLGAEVPGGAFGAVAGSTVAQLNTGDKVDFHLGSQRGTSILGNSVQTRVWGVRIDSLPYFIADKNSTAQSVPSALASTTKLNWPRTLADTSGQFDPTNSVLRAKNDNEVWVAGSTTTPINDGQQYHALMNKNATEVQRLGSAVPGGAYAASSGSALAELNVNDTLEVRGASQNGTTLDGLSANGRYWGFRLNPAGSALPHISADKNGSTQNLPPGSSPTKITWGRETNDSDGSFDLGNSEIRAKTSGQKWLVGFVTTQASDSGEIQVIGYKNGSPYARIDGQVPGGSGATASGSTLVQLESNDTFDLRVSLANGGEISGDTVSTRMWALRVDSFPHFIADQGGNGQDVLAGSDPATATKMAPSREVANVGGGWDTNTRELRASANAEAWLVGATFTPALNGGPAHTYVHRNGALNTRLGSEVPGGADGPVHGSTIAQLNSGDALDFRAQSEFGTATSGSPVDNRVWGIKVDSLPYFIADKNGGSQAIQSSLANASKVTWSSTAGTTTEFEGPESRIKATKNGETWITGSIVTPATNGGRLATRVKKNEVDLQRLGTAVPGGILAATNGSALADLNARETLSISASSENGTTLDGMPANGRFWGFKI